MLHVYFQNFQIATFLKTVCVCACVCVCVCVYIYIVRQKVLSDERLGAKLSNRESMRSL